MREIAGLISLFRSFRFFAAMLFAFSSATALAADDPYAAAQALLARLTPAAPTAEYARVAREFGDVVDSARQNGAPDSVLEELRKTAGKMRDKAHERLRAAEAAAGDSEGDLEQIYKSNTWDDLSFALSAFPYWRSWIDLTFAERPSQTAKRSRRIWHAKRGFRAASMQLYQPNLVYGGWLGLAFVAKAEDEHSRAMQILEALKKALDGQPNHPIYKLVLAQMSVMRGETPPPDAQASKIKSTSGGADPATEALHAEAMMLLQKHRTTEVGAREAAEKIRAIIDSGHMTMAILGDVLNYQKEIARESLGVYTDLLLAEYNFNNQQWYTAVQKYRAFFDQGLKAPGMNFDRFKYRLAVAFLKSDLNDESAREADKLIRPGVEDAVQKAAIKLAYIARARNADNQTTNAGRTALTNAAKRFVAQAPTDADADGARLILAQSSGDSGAALKYLNSVQGNAKFAGGVERTRFYVIAKDFARAAQKGDGLETLAHQAIAAWEELPAEEKKPAQNQAFFFQLLAVTEPKPESLLPRLEVAEKKAQALGSSIQRTYLWSRLKIYERMGQPERLLSDIQAQGGKSVEGWQLEQYYPFVRKQKDLNLRTKISAALAPNLKAQPEMERRFRLLEIEDLLALNRGEDAYNKSKLLIKDYPRAGDGYRMLAKSAQATKRSIEADNAWRIITEKVPPKQEVWWEGMLNRIEIRSTSTRPDSACELVSTVSKRLPAPNDAYKNRFASLRSRVSCAANTGA